MFGIDYATSYLNAARLKLNGVKFVCRYLSGGNTKDLTRAEKVALRLARIPIVLVYETDGKTGPLQGFAGGLRHARAARAQAAGLGMGDAVIYFAVDFDASPGQQAAINDYLHGASSILGDKRVGVYGGFYVVKRALDAGVCAFAWQTYAWSGGQWDSRAHIQQYRNGTRLAGLSVDFDRSVKGDYGQYPRPTKPVPTPQPKPAKIPRYEVISDGKVVNGRTMYPGRFLVGWSVFRHKPKLVSIKQLPS